MSERAEALPYRSGLDGLRALAVLAVISTHLKLPGFSGGFLGVDVFFVLSGYLIYAGSGAGGAPGRQWSRLFYLRRIRRIVPAYYAMLAVSLAAGLLLLMPGDLTLLAGGIIASALFVPNILFWTQSGYFDPPASLNPLLHAWSLGVEAQFYLLFPLLPWMLAKARPHWRQVYLAGLTLAAFGLCLALRQVSPSASFYLIPGRLWEFLAGCLAASSRWPAIPSRLLREGLGAAGLAALGVSMATFDSATSHPSLASLIPVLATLALIQTASQGDSLAGWVLQLKPLVITGRLSYALYLWHWPLIVFARYAGLPFTPLTLSAGIAILALISVAGWALIETPVRAGLSPRIRQMAAGGAALLAASVAILVLRGLPQRFPPEVAQIADYYDFGERAPYREGSCFLTTRQSIGDFKPSLCLKIDPAAKNVLVLGDSHAAHLWAGLQAAWPGVHFLQATASGCKPSLRPVGARRCTALMRRIVTAFLPKNHLDAVLVAALWDEDDIGPLRDLTGVLQSYAGRVDVVGPMPRYDQPVATLLAQSLWQNDLASLGLHRLASVPLLDRKMAAAFAGPVHYVSAYRAMCPQDDCLLFAAPGIPMQFDYHHLTDRGGERLVAILKAKRDLTF